MQVADSAALNITLGNWHTQQAQAVPLRHAVFVLEQHVPLELELDEMDALSVHALAMHGDEAVGTARLLPDGHVGRMAVLPAWRGQGVGSALLQALLEHARSQGHAQVLLNAQVHAAGFYARHGFVQQGGVFDDAGIPHVEMVRRL
jgi:predicted GNAT family N-acyltransferase